MFDHPENVFVEGLLVAPLVNPCCGCALTCYTKEKKVQIKHIAVWLDLSVTYAEGCGVSRHHRYHQ